MNAYYEKKANFSSNKDTNSRFSNVAESAFEKSEESLAQWICRLRAQSERLPKTRIVALLRTVVLSALLIGFLGILGAVEHGSLTMLEGALIGAVLVVGEYLVLRPNKKNRLDGSSEQSIDEKSSRESSF